MTGLDLRALAIRVAEYDPDGMPYPDQARASPEAARVLRAAIALRERRELAVERASPRDWTSRPAFGRIDPKR
jgi:hypothetical protein